MIRVRNKKVVSEVAKTTYIGNKRRNLLTIFAIMVTTFLITVVIALGTSYWNTISTRMIRMNGMDYDIELSEPAEKQVDIIRSMDSVETAGIKVKCGIIESYQGIKLDKTRMYWLDDICWEKQCIPALENFEGTYPEKEKEVMLSNSALQAMGIKNPKIGMKLKLDYFTLDDDETQDMLEKEFTLSGYYTDYSGSDKAYVSEVFFKGTGVKQTDFTQGTLTITLKNPLYSEADIMSMQNKIGLTNNQIINADYDTITDFCKTVFGLLGMLIMIFASGYLFIYNTLYISIGKDIRYYGQLKTIGMTSKQLKSMIYQQAVWNSIFGIPIGLLFSIIVVNGIIPNMIHLADSLIEIKDIAAVQPWIYVIAAIFAFLTNMVSSKQPAKIVADCSPIEATCYITGMQGIKERRSNDGGLGSMAIQNMFRDKKQTFVILLSFVIAISIFIIANVVIKGNDAKSVLNAVSDRDIRFINQQTLDETTQYITDEQIDQLKKIDGVRNVSKVTSAKVVIPYREEVYKTFFEDLYASRYAPGNYEEDMKKYKDNPESDFWTPRFIGIDEIKFEKLNESLGGVLDKESFENGDIVVVQSFYLDGTDKGMCGKPIDFYFPGSDVSYTTTIAAVADSNPAYFAGGYVPDLIVSEKHASELLSNTHTELINVRYDNAYSKATEEAVLSVFKNEKKVSHESKLERYEEMKPSERQVTILGISIGTIMGLLALLNYINMMAASVQNRSKEFATLESIGMTSIQLRKMLAYEGIGYAVISILLSLAIGTPISVLVFQSMNKYGIQYVFPWSSNLVLIIGIVALCMIVPVLLYQQMQKESIVERLCGLEG